MSEKPNPVRITLAVSLLLNALLVGSFLGQVWKGPPPPPPPWHHGAPDMAASLPAEKRALFEAAMKQMGDDTAPMREQFSDARKEARRILKTDPFDQAAYLQQVERIKNATGQMADRMAKTVSTLAPQFTVEERTQLATMLRSQHFHGHGNCPPPPAPPPPCDTNPPPSPGEEPPMTDGDEDSPAPPPGDEPPPPHP